MGHSRTDGRYENVSGKTNSDTTLDCRNYPSLEQSHIAYETYPAELSLLPEGVSHVGVRRFAPSPLTLLPTELAVAIPISNVNFDGGFAYLEFSSSNTNMIPVNIDTVLSSNVHTHCQWWRYPPPTEITANGAYQFNSTQLSQATLSGSSGHSSAEWSTQVILRDIVHHFPVPCENEQQLYQNLDSVGQEFDASEHQSRFRSCSSHRPTVGFLGMGTGGSLEGGVVNDMEDEAVGDIRDPWPHMCHDPRRFEVITFIQLVCGHKFAELGCGHKLVQFRCGHKFFCPDGCAKAFFNNHQCVVPKARPVYRTAGSQGCHLQTDINSCDIYVKVNFPCGHSGYFPCESLTPIEGVDLGALHFQNSNGTVEATFVSIGGSVPER